MQILIDIPEEVYNLCKGLYDTEGLNNLAIAVKYGTPLPKGHGRIADMDEAIKCIEDVNGDDAIWAIGLIEWACGKRTIIEADTESEGAE